MVYTKLPKVNDNIKYELEYFPSHFHAAVFRLWETVRAEKIASALGVSEDIVNKAAFDMGLPEQKFNPKWEDRGYITTIRNAWHILPYNQLLALLDKNEDELAVLLKEEDFLASKLGIKPFCEEVKPVVLDSEGEKKLADIKEISKKYFSALFDGMPCFDFFEESVCESDRDVHCDGLRMIYSYCGLYGSVLDNDISVSYPENMLKMYRDVGVNAIWMQAVLYQLVPFPFDESFSKGWEKRCERLRELIKLAEKYGIKVYLYLNEPRCMPLWFFEKHPELKGKVSNNKASLCTSRPEVMEYLRYAVKTLCENVPGIGGFFTITCSENLTHCKSRKEGEECPVCKDVPIYKLVSDVVCAISEESRSVDPNIKTIAWTWAWENFMSEEDIRKCMDIIPKEVIMQSNSEAHKEFVIGGVKGEINDYSISIPGPAPLSQRMWEYARSVGHDTCAKVQINVSWECSTVPFLPVFDLIREHMSGLRKTGVKHLMLSWTLGGYPSISLKVASECLEDPSEEKYNSLLKKEYGVYAETVKQAASMFSHAFREFPFHIESLYFGPQNAGPSNPLYLEPTGRKATMTCFSFDDIDTWRVDYPREVYIDQFKKLSEKWKKGLEVIENMPDCLFKQAAWGGYALFRSSYLQAEFTHKRTCGDKKYLYEIAEEEKSLALLMYELMQKSSLFGYEAANHYYFNRGMLAEKVINCEYIKKALNS